MPQPWKPKRSAELGQQEQYRCVTTSATDMLFTICYQCSIRMTSSRNGRFWSIVHVHLQSLRWEKTSKIILSTHHPCAPYIMSLRCLSTVWRVDSSFCLAIFMLACSFSLERRGPGDTIPLSVLYCWCFCSEYVFLIVRDAAPKAKGTVAHKSILKECC